MYFLQPGQRVLFSGKISNGKLACTRLKKSGYRESESEVHSSYHKWVFSCATSVHFIEQSVTLSQLSCQCIFFFFSTFFQAKDGSFGKITNGCYVGTVDSILDNCKTTFIVRPTELCIDCDKSTALLITIIYFYPSTVPLCFFLFFYLTFSMFS